MPTVTFTWFNVFAAIMRHAVYLCKVKRELPFPVSLWHFLEVFSLCVCVARGALVNIIFFLFFGNFLLRYFDKEYDLKI